MRGGREADAQVGEDKEKGVRKKKKVNKVKEEESLLKEMVKEEEEVEEENSSARFQSVSQDFPAINPHLGLLRETE